MSASDSPPLAWIVRVEDVPERGLAWSATATPAERKSVAAALELLDVPKLTASGRIQAVAGGSYRLTGRLVADVVQACVVSLDPVASSIDDAIDAEFRPDAPDDELATTPDYEAGSSDIEAIVNGGLETGRLIYEHLAASLDPYPRASGAGTPIDLTAKPKGAMADDNPFAKLAALKGKDRAGGDQS